MEVGVTKSYSSMCQLSLRVFPGGYNPQDQIIMMNSDEITTERRPKPISTTTL